MAEGGAVPSTPPSNVNKPDDDGDVEWPAAAAIMQPEELRRKKCIKWAFFAAAFSALQTAIILVFVLVIMKYETPKFRLRSAMFDNFETAVSVKNPTSVIYGVNNSRFNARMKAQLGVKNSNFGPYKYQNSKVEVFYRGFLVGEAFIPKSKVGFQSTKKFEVVVKLSSENVSDVMQLGSELSSGMLRLNVRSKLEGKVKLLFVMKRKKTSEMDCNFTIDLDKKACQDIKCSK